MIEGWLSHNASWIVATAIVAVGWIVSGTRNRTSLEEQVKQRATKEELAQKKAELKELVDRKVDLASCHDLRKSCKAEIVSALREGLAPIWSRIDTQANKHDALARDFAATDAKLNEATETLKEAVAELREANAGGVR